MATGISNDVVKGIEQSPLVTKYTDILEVITALDIDGTDRSVEIDVRAYSVLGLFFEIDVNDTDEVAFELYGRIETGGDDYYISTTQIFTGGSLTDLKKYYYVDTDTLKFLYVNITSNLISGTTGTVTLSINKKYNK